MILNIDRVVSLDTTERLEWMASREGKVALVASVKGQRILLEMTHVEAKEMACAGIVAAAQAMRFAVESERLRPP
jgi:hypothetical protein